MCLVICKKNIIKWSHKTLSSGIQKYHTLHKQLCASPQDLEKIYVVCFVLLKNNWWNTWMTRWMGWIYFSIFWSIFLHLLINFFGFRYCPLSETKKVMHKQILQGYFIHVWQYMYIYLRLASMPMNAILSSCSSSLSSVLLSPLKKK